MAAPENNHVFEPIRDTPMERLRETWTCILTGRGWEFNLMKNTTLMSVPTGFALAFFSRSSQNRAVVVEQLVKQNVRETDMPVLLNKALNRANWRTALKFGWRYATIPIVLCGVTLSTFSYRNTIYAPDFAASYGICGGLSFAPQGAKRAAKAATISATFGLLTAAMIWLIMYTNDICVQDLRAGLSADYNFGVEHRNRMRMYEKKEDEYAKILLELERQQLQARKDAVNRN